jgi:hypothetical protein
MIQADKIITKRESRIASFRSILMRRGSKDLLAFRECELAYHRATGRIQFDHVSRLPVLTYQSSTSGLKGRVDAVLQRFAVSGGSESIASGFWTRNNNTSAVTEWHFIRISLGFFRGFLLTADGDRMVLPLGYSMDLKGCLFLHI